MIAQSGFDQFFRTSIGLSFVPKAMDMGYEHVHITYTSLRIKKVIDIDMDNKKNAH